MSIKPIHVVFELDGTGVYYDPSEPIMLDALLSWALCPLQARSEPPQRDEAPPLIRIPLGRWRYDRHTWGWCASGLVPEGAPLETTRWWRKKFQANRVEMINRTVNTRVGVTREYNQPMPLLMASRMEAWAVGDRKRVQQALRKNIRYLGKKRSQGLGRVRSIDVEWCDEDYSGVRNGIAMRQLPDPEGWRLVRAIPPYWNNVDRVRCCEFGAPAPAWALDYDFVRGWRGL